MKDGNKLHPKFVFKVITNFGLPDFFLGINSFVRCEKGPCNYNSRISNSMASVKRNFVAHLLTIIFHAGTIPPEASYVLYKVVKPFDAYFPRDCVQRVL